MVEESDDVHGETEKTNTSERAAPTSIAAQRLVLAERCDGGEEHRPPLRALRASNPACGMGGEINFSLSKKQLWTDIMS